MTELRTNTRLEQRAPTKHTHTPKPKAFPPCFSPATIYTLTYGRGNQEPHTHAKGAPSRSESVALFARNDRLASVSVFALVSWRVSVSVSAVGAFMIKHIHARTWANLRSVTAPRTFVFENGWLSTSPRAPAPAPSMPPPPTPLPLPLLSADAEAWKTLATSSFSSHRWVEKVRFDSILFDSS